MSTSTKPILISWPDTQSVKQCFSFPSTVIYYMTINPSTPTCYAKMARSCKYFFEKNPILVVNRIDDENRFCAHNEEDCGKNDEKCCLNFDICDIINRIWLTNKLSFLYTTIISTNFVLLFHEQIYRNENTELVLTDAEVNLDEFQLLAFSFKKFNLNFTKVTFDDGSIVLLDKIIEVIPKLEEFEYWFDTDIPVVTASTFNKICNLKNLRNLKSFILWDIPEMVSVEDFYTFIQNKNNDTFVKLDFSHHISEDYKRQLDKLVDHLIASKIPKILVEYNEQNEKKLAIMESR